MAQYLKVKTDDLETLVPIKDTYLTKVTELDGQITEINTELSKTLITDAQTLTDAQKTQVKANIGVVVDSVLDSTSENPVQNKVINTKIQEIENTVSDVDAKATSASNAATGAVKYNVSQELTNDQQTQARENIGASNMAASVNNEVLVFSGNSGSGGGGSGGSIIVDEELSTTSTNPVQNKVITNTINNLPKIQVVSAVPTSPVANTLYLVY